MEKLNKLVQWVIVLMVCIAPFLTFEQNEQAPFELPKMVFLSFMGVLAMTIYCVSALWGPTWKIKWNHGLSLVSLLFVVTFLSYLTSTDQFSSFWGNNNIPSDSLLTAGLYLGICFVVVQVFSGSAELKKLNGALIFSAFGLAVYSVVQHFGYDPIDWWGYADMRTLAYATIGQPVGFSTIVGCIIPLVLVWHLRQRSALGVWGSLSILFVILLGQLYSGSRTPVALTIIFCFALVTYAVYRDRSLKKRAAIVLAAQVLALLIYFLEGNSAIAQKLQEVSLKSGVSERVQVWNDSIEIWKKYPILGSGPETFGLQLKLVNKPEFNTNSKWAMYWHKAHNHFFHFLATLGLVGLSAHFIFIFGVLYFLWIEIKRYSQTLVDAPKAKKLGMEAQREQLEHNLLLMSYLAAPVYVYIANLTAFNFIITQLFCLLFVALFFAANEKARVFKLEISFPFKLNFLNMILLITLTNLFGYEVWKFWQADRHFSVSRRLWEGERNIPAAMERIDLAIQTKPNDCRHPIRKAVYLSNIYRYEFKNNPQFRKDDAFMYLKQLTTEAVNCFIPSPENWFMRGRIFADLYNDKMISTIELAEESFKKGWEFAPVNPVFPYSLAIVYKDYGRVADFVTTLKESIRLKIDYFVSYSALMQYFIETKNDGEINWLLDNMEKVEITTGPLLAELPKMSAMLASAGKIAQQKRVDEVYKKLEKFK